MLHSWSLRRRRTPTPSAGGGLASAYGYIESSHEPLCPDSFRRRSSPVERLAGFRWEQPCGTGRASRRSRCPGHQLPRRSLHEVLQSRSYETTDGGTDRSGRCGLAECQDRGERSDRRRRLSKRGAFAEAIRLQELVGNDIMAVSLWNQPGDNVAGQVSGGRSVHCSGSRSRPRCGHSNDDRVTVEGTRHALVVAGLAVMQPGGHEYADLLDRNVRKQFPSSDMRRLGPALQRERGGAYVNSRLKELERTAANQRERKALIELQSRYR